MRLSKLNRRQRNIAQRNTTVESLERRVLFSGTLNGEADPIEPDIYEPNNSFAAASDLGATNTVSIGGLTVHATNDLDYYKFTATATQPLVVQIAFSHAMGNLALAVYDSAHTLLGSSNTSTPTNGIETVLLNATAGQVYYARVSGVHSPWYDLTVQPLSIAFDWSMPRRFGGQLDQWGLPIVPNTHDYAFPNPVVINGIETPQFGVRLDASGTNLGSNNVTYNWHIAGSLLTRDISSTGLVTNTDLPQGQYNVTLTANGGGNTLTLTKPISVVDRLIVAVGDSYGAGEGNPHQVVQYDFFGFPTSGAKWAQGLDDPTTAAHRRAHRSSYAGVVQAAVQLENADPKSSVTLVFLDHTGATIRNLIDISQPSGDTAEPGSDAPQLPQLAQIIGNRHIDALVMSIGGNDAGFADIGAQLVQADPDRDGANYGPELAAIWNDAATRRAFMVSRFDSLAFALRSFDIGQTFLVEYADPTHNSAGGTPAKILDDIADGYEIDANELGLVRSKVLQPMAFAMVQSAHKHGWSYISNIAEQFSHMGYGEGFRTASESVVMQGPIGNRNFPSTEEKAGTLGTLHPTADAQHVFRDRIAASYGLADLVATNFSVSPDAFVSSAGTYTLTITNRSPFTGAGSSTARIFISTDTTFDGSDLGVMNVSVPPMGPGEVLTISSSLPVYASPPFITAGNVLYVGAIVDVGGQVAESDEVNLPTGNNDIAAVRLDKHLSWQETPTLPIATPIAVGQSLIARLGLDELIGAYDKDFYSFTVNAGDKIAFDIDNDATSPNMPSQLVLYSFAGGVASGPIDWSTASQAPGEPNNPNESYLQHTFTSGGQYLLIVGSRADGVFADPFNLLLRQPGGGVGTYSLSTTRVIAQPPAVTSASYDYDARQSFSFTFNTPVLANSLAGGLGLTNLTSGAAIDPALIDATYDAASRTATFTMHNGAILPDGNWIATLDAAHVLNTEGTAMAQSYQMSAHFLAADANRDRHVDAADQAILSAHIGQTDAHFAHGDFNYDGVVNSADQAILNQQLHVWLPPQGTLDLPTGSGNDTFRLVGESSSMIDVFMNSSTVTWRIPRGTFDLMTINGGSGNDIVTLDYSNGAPLNNSGLQFNGGDGLDILLVLGSSGIDSAWFAADRFTPGVGGLTILQNIEGRQFDGRGGWDQLSIDSTTVTMIATQHLNSLSLVGASAVASMSQGINALLATRWIGMSTGARLDLNDNDLLLDYSGDSWMGWMQAAINTARAGGSWTGSGITSGAAHVRPQHNTTLGAMEASEFRSIYGNSATFDGEALDSTAVLVKYTYYGDTDFNGVVNFDDYVRTDNGFNNHRSGWVNGDFDGNGTVNFDDYVLIDLSFNTQSGVL